MPYFNTNSGTPSSGQKMQLTGQNLYNEDAQCDMRGDTNFKVSTRVPFLFNFHSVAGA